MCTASVHAWPRRTDARFLRVAGPKAVLASQSPPNVKTTDVMLLQPLKGHGSFERVLKTGRRTSNGPLSLTIGVSSAKTDTISVGVSVPRRNVSSAVIRNRIKRLLRVAILKSVHEQNVRCRKRGVNVIVAIWRSAPTAASLINLRDVSPIVSAIMKRALDACPPLPDGLDS